MNQGKLEVVKQEMARMNINILGISELKWKGIGEFNSDNHSIHYRWQESLRRNGIAITVNKSLKCSTWVQSQNDRMILVYFQGKPFNITVIYVQPLMLRKLNSSMKTYKIFWNWHTKKDVLFIIEDWNAKVGSQETSGVTGKFGLGVQNEAGQRLIELC